MDSDAGSDAAPSDAGPDAACSLHDAGPVPDATMAIDAAPSDPLCAGSVCGGDITGTWQVIMGCAGGEGDATFLSCTPGTLTYLEWSAMGTFTFAADGTMSTNAGEHFRGQAFLPLSCYRTVSTCRGLDGLALRSMILATCTDHPRTTECDPQYCDCGIAIDRSAVMLMGTYTADPVSGTVTAVLGPETISGEYCVTGSQLWLHAHRYGNVSYYYRFQRVVP